MKKSILFSAVILLIVTLALPAHAQEETEMGPWERFSVSLGGFGAVSNSDVRIGTNVAGIGVDVDVEEALNVSSSQSAVRLEALWRIGQKRRHRVGLSVFEFRRNGSAVAGTDITIGEIEIQQGDSVKTTYNTGIIKADYAYSFFMDDRFNLAVSGGIFFMPIELGISASGVGSETTSITAPLPTFGLSADFALSPKWILKQRLELFYLEIGDYRGAILDTNVMLEWNVWEHWGFGAGFDSFRVQVEARDEDEIPGVDFVGSIKWSYTGLMLYVKYRF